MADPLTLSFTEEMKGFVAFGERDYADGFDKGRESGVSLMFHLTITATELDRFLADPKHEAEAVGWIECEQLGGRRPVDRGIFNLFVDSEEPRTTHMLYRLPFVDGLGNPMTLAGFKVLRDDPGFDVWADTSTLYTSVLRGHVEAAPGAAEDSDAGERAAVGIINIHLSDFARQLTTFRVRGGSPTDNLGGLARFGGLFLGKLWEQYGPAARKGVEEEG